MNDPTVKLPALDQLYICPICRKCFGEEKALYRHIIQVHDDKQYMSYDMRADMYQRWQNRLPECRQ